jgi:DNA-binding protein Fis
MSQMITLHNVSEEMASALQAKAKVQGKSINDVALEALAAGMNLNGEKKRDLSDLTGTWVEDPEFDAIMREQDQIDLEIWK